MSRFASTRAQRHRLGTRDMGVHDPFGNHLIFTQPIVKR